MTNAVAALVVLGAVLASAKPPAFLPGAGPADAAGPFKGRSLVGLGAPAPADDGAADPSSFGPFSPFLKLKPFLPAKPTFMPPVVDPSKFIDMKASLLNSLFPGGLPAASPLTGAAPPAYGGVSARALFSPFAAPAAPAAAGPVVKPPPPAFLADLFKALNINKTVANATDPAAAYPSYPAPAYPGAAPSAPAVDPGVFISKKAKFLSDLFAGIATTTPAPPPAEAAAPDTAALNAELVASLKRLLDSLAAPVDAPEDEQEAAGKALPVKRAADSAVLVADAKDKAVGTIIGELVVLKNGMVGAVADLAAAQQVRQAADAAAATTAAPKKPLSPYAALWAKPSSTAAPAKAAPAVEPVRQKVVLLGQVFDMLTDIEKDITSSMAVPTTPDEEPAVSAPAATPSLADLVQAKISQIVAQSNTSSSALPSATNRTATAPAAVSKALRLAPPVPAPAAGVPVDPTFWIPDTAVAGPDAYLAKTKEFLSNILAAKSTPSPVVRRSYKPQYYQQQQDQQGPQPSQPQQPWSSSGQPAKVDAQRGPAAAAAYIAYQLQHHHHHNPPPFWWN
ncbi:hypothetical protein ONE63_005243 [Megalurothrips usitatus]|uniref:Uncharacterized protein n=1 Tax=Megalurothrips usitatus TaxID=439358 RepID=A0AAV7XXC5_9NEOP|nr:hypothetical protein ONE63_005243 [Megalurothrips usitatus]